MDDLRKARLEQVEQKARDAAKRLGLDPEFYAEKAMREYMEWVT